MKRFLVTREGQPEIREWFDTEDEASEWIGARPDTDAVHAGLYSLEDMGEPERLGPWIICPTCSGEGKSSRHLGVVNPDDFSDDDWDYYLAGGYDVQCHVCSGTGKVRDSPEVWLQHNRQLALERGVNDAGERLW